jgi:hypothetical protein
MSVEEDKSIVSHVSLIFSDMNTLEYKDEYSSLKT